MRQTAVFIDAGYLFAAGSSLITGSKVPRVSCSLDIDKAIETISEFAQAVEPNARLLRIYWYDGIRPYSGPSAEQMALGQTQNVKMRLGLLNSQGQQKGVDSLIVTDLIDLARNKAICDAVILAGDEDLRVGVQVAQSFGVRVHLLSITPTRGNVSPHLIQEIDSLTEMSKDHVASFLTCKATETAHPAPSNVKVPLEQPKHGPNDSTNLRVIAGAILDRFDKQQKLIFKKYLLDFKSLPREIDAPMMAQARHEAERDLSVEEKRKMRSYARELLEAAE